jgi:hypothetical protein
MTIAEAAVSPPAADLPGFAPQRRRWADWAARGIALALLAAVALQLEDAGAGLIDAVLPDGPLFWLCLAASYLALPAADWAIFRRLWRLPLSGFPVIMRKRIANELLLSYSGEVYFYLWARRRAALTAAPFGAIKDVNILSALAANVATLALVAAALPFAHTLPGLHGSGGLLSAGAVVLMSMLLLLAGRRLFTLDRAQLGWVFQVHVLRLIATNLLLAAAWGLALPSVPMGLWVVLTALRLLVSRLPFLPGKDLLFATAAAFLVGQESAVAALMAVTAAIMLAAHVVLGGMLAIWGLVEEGRP